MLVRRLAAVYLILLAVVVAGHFLATQLYDPMLEGTALDVWRVLDPLMVSGVIIALIVALDRKLNGGDSQGITRDYLEANFTFYFSAALLLASPGTGSVLNGWSHATTVRCCGYS